MKQDKTIKSLKLPVVGNFTELNYSWNKSGGYAGGITLQRIKDNAKKLGWSNQPVPSKHHPTGSWVLNTEILFSPDGKYKMTTSSHYGDMAYQNRYTITVETIQE